MGDKIWSIPCGATAAALLKKKKKYLCTND